MLQCLVVDDEPLARQILENYIKRTPGLRYIGSCINAIEAYQFLESKKIDLLFLDIKMPVIDGLTFLRSLKEPPTVVFTTAFTTHAVESYELNAIDYLVKPFSYQRFCQSLDKAKKQTQVSPVTQPKDYLFIKKDSQLIKVFFNEISYIEARKDYLKIHTTDAVHLTYMTMKYIQDLLPSTFIRIHRSYIISKNELIKISRTKIELKGGLEFPVGDSYRDKVQKVFNKEK